MSSRRLSVGRRRKVKEMKKSNGFLVFLPEQIIAIRDQFIYMLYPLFVAIAKLVGWMVAKQRNQNHEYCG